MTKTLHGKVRGKTIELDEDPGVAEGQEVEVLMKVVTPPCSVDKPAAACQPEAAPKKLPGPPPGWKPGAPSKVAGVLADEWTEEDDATLEQIHADRKAATWRESVE